MRLKGNNILTVRYLIHILLFIGTFLSEPIFSQDENSLPTESTSNDEPIIYKKNYFLLSPRVSVTVPHPMGNKAFRKCFVGIYEFSGGLNIYYYKGLFIGGTYKNGLLRITENKIADYNASLSINNFGVKFGTDLYLGEKNKIIFSAAITGGQNYATYSGIVCKESNESPKISSYTTSYLEPEINLFFLVEPNFGIGASVSYSIFNTVFNPYDLCLDDWTSFSKENPGKTRYLSFGFGFYYSLIKKEKKQRGGY